MLCPCNPNKQFHNCCLAIITGDKQAQSPEQLMRSRYTAYVVNDARYIFNSYSQYSQTEQSVSDIEKWASTCQFIELVIHQSSPFNKLNSEQITDFSIVEFTAFYLIANTLYKMSEKSRFIQEPIQKNNNSTDCKHWVYHDGDVYQHIAITLIKPHNLCPCAINKAKEVKKKFNNCCGQ
tara:strand:- start:103 stop:639 length:537 start_codon:yes stop_codon:yes gene_type:complete